MHSVEIFMIDAGISLAQLRLVCEIPRSFERASPSNVRALQIFERKVLSSI